MSAAEVRVPRLQDIHRTKAQLRVLAAALDLFADHGVSGTSLQMIADAIGVTKAAVYKQFRSKDELVLAVAEAEFAHIEAALEVAEAEPSSREARQTLLSHVVATAVRRRRWVRALQNDPIMIKLLASHGPLSDINQRILRILVGEAGDKTLVKIAILGGVIGSAVVSPLVAGIDDATLLEELLEESRRLFGIAD